MATTDMTTLVVTSIAAPTECMRRLAAGARTRAIPFYCVGDVPSPPDFALDGCDFLSLAAQKQMPFAFARIAPERHYARKNIGYLQAMARGAEFILETDDDNYPAEGFWDVAHADDLVAVRARDGSTSTSGLGRMPGRAVSRWSWRCPPTRGSRAARRGGPSLIWQGLVAGEPDVDATFRLTRRQRVEFSVAAPVILGPGVWSPFNSQNTRWARAAFPLMYLPSTCSFRATDIMRGYVAMRCLWELDAGVAFTTPTAVQERNIHDLMRDFRDELAIYLGAAQIAAALERLLLAPGPDALCANLARCYALLVERQVVRPEELDLLDAWLRDIQAFEKE